MPITYHRRSLVEAKMYCFKRLGERVKRQPLPRSVTEVYAITDWARGSSRVAGQPLRRKAAGRGVRQGYYRATSSAFLNTEHRSRPPSFAW